MPNIDIDIDIDEFLWSCRKSDIDEIVDYLIKDGTLCKVESLPTEQLTIPEIQFNEMLNKISKNRLQLTMDEEELLRKLASRF